MHIHKSLQLLPGAFSLLLSSSFITVQPPRHCFLYYCCSALSTVHFSTRPASISSWLRHNSRSPPSHISRNYPPSDFLCNLYELNPECSVYLQNSLGVNLKNEGFSQGGRAAGIWVSAKRDVQKKEVWGHTTTAGKTHQYQITYAKQVSLCIFTLLDNV